MLGKKEKNEERKDPWRAEATQGVFKNTSYAYICARFFHKSPFDRQDISTGLAKPKYELFSDVKSEVCWLGVGSTDIYIPNISPSSPKELGQYLFFHERELNAKGTNVLFKNQVPPNHTDISGHDMRSAIPPNLFFEVLVEMNRLFEVYRSEFNHSQSLKSRNSLIPSS